MHVEGLRGPVVFIRPPQTPKGAALKAADLAERHVSNDKANHSFVSAFFSQEVMRNTRAELA